MLPVVRPGHRPDAGEVIRTGERTGGGRVLTGVLRSGFGRGAHFVALDWVQAQVQAQIGFTPYPGTLNLAIPEREAAALLALRGQGRRLDPPGKHGCGAACLPVVIGTSIPGAIVFPDTTDHPTGYIEVVAPVCVREALRLQEGDPVLIEVHLSPVQP